MLMWICVVQAVFDSHCFQICMRISVGNVMRAMPDGFWSAEVNRPSLGCRHVWYADILSAAFSNAEI